MPDILTDATSLLLSRALDTAALRQRVIANNIANINTPGFKRSYVTFEEQLREALSGAGETGVSRAIEDIRPRVHQDKATSLRSDGNNVDMDREMAEMAMNSINYNTAAQQLNNKLAMLRYVINEGRR